MADVERALAALRDAADAAGDLLGPDAIEPVTRHLAAVERRHGYLGPAVLVALVGGTGSGKSSLLNALSGSDLVPTGVLRPTTQRPAAWVAETADESLWRLLDDTGIEERHGYGFAEHLAVVDLPDLDSVELAHRATVDALLPRADLIVWVLDPQKYNDRLVHDRIGARAAYADQSLFVLNHGDRLSPPERDALRRDLESTLRADGIARPTVLVTAAAPDLGDKLGIESLRRELDRRAQMKDAVLAKLAQDLRQVTDQLATVTGVDEHASHDAAAGTWDECRDAAAAEVADAAVDEATVERAVRAGAATAVATGSGPAGRVWHGLRRSVVGRALGLPQDTPTDERGLLLASEQTRQGATAATTLTRGLVDLSAELGGRAGPPAPSRRRAGTDRRRDRRCPPGRPCRGAAARGRVPTRLVGPGGAPADAADPDRAGRRRVVVGGPRRGLARVGAVAARHDRGRDRPRAARRPAAASQRAGGGTPDRARLPRGARQRGVDRSRGAAGRRGQRHPGGPARPARRAGPGT